MAGPILNWGVLGSGVGWDLGWAGMEVACKVGWAEVGVPKWARRGAMGVFYPTRPKGAMGRLWSCRVEESRPKSGRVVS